MINVTCPHCKGELQSEFTSPDMVIQCPLCGRKFALPHNRGTESSAPRRRGLFARFRMDGKSRRTHYPFARIVCLLIRVAATMVFLGGGYLIIAKFNVYRLTGLAIQAQHDTPKLHKIVRQIQQVNETWTGTVAILDRKQSREYTVSGLTIPDSIRMRYLDQPEVLDEVPAVDEMLDSVETFEREAIAALQNLLADHLNKTLDELGRYADDSKRTVIYWGRSFGGKVSYNHVSNVIFYQKSVEPEQYATVEKLLTQTKEIKEFIDRQKILISGFDADYKKLIALLEFLEKNCFSKEIRRTVGGDGINTVTVEKAEDRIKAQIREALETLRGMIGNLKFGWQVKAETDLLTETLRQRKYSLMARDLKLRTLKAEYIREQVIFIVSWLLFTLLILGGADALLVWFDFGDYVSREDN